MKPSEILGLDKKARAELWEHVVDTIERYTTDVDRARAAPILDLEKIRSLLTPFQYTAPRDPREALDFVVQGLWDYQVHTPHPRYFGLFNPAPTAMGIAADTLVALFNPQLAAWSHSPFANEIERHLIHFFGTLFGYDPPDIDGAFASGGAEANHTALLTALVHAFPEFSQRGLRGIEKQPALYVSAQAHDSFLKAARACGLGTDSVRHIPVDHALRMDVKALAEGISRDRAAGFAPFMIAATAGTTNAGAVDPLERIAAVASREKVWYHVDAAWGGAAVFVPELRHLLNGIERSDSITFDAHKWLSVPMGAGLYLTRHADILGRTFRISTDYMPTDAAGMNVVDPYAHTMQWSRRFIGLKIFLSLLVAGQDGYEIVIRHQTEMGDVLRRELESTGWAVLNRTQLPVVCFVDKQHTDGHSSTFVQSVAREVVSSGEAWISATVLGEGTPALRACITNYRTEPADIDALVHALNTARKKVVGRA